SLPDESKLLYDLNTIKNEMMSYERTRVGNGVSLLEKINSQMKAIQESKNYLKIDLFSNQNCPKIEISLLNQLTDLFNFLEKVTPDYIRFESIRKYTEKFTDKYGLFRELIVSDLIL
ncbi:MAG: lantibiotic dehydratase family protein, partial [Lactobacillus sp.]|nr:lantibiotic dehydratase family protein [Lactobacillus sp.]